jgi:hypothetical protein
MVCTRTCNFALDVPEVSSAHGGAAPTGPHGVAPTGPRGATPMSPPPSPPMSIEQLLATQNKLMWVLTENLVHWRGH